MTIEKKANALFDSGLSFNIYNKPVAFDHLWDIRLFWKHMEYNNKEIVKQCKSKGFTSLNECLDDALHYLENFDN